MSENSYSQISESVITRICHDLVGSVGAISNGVELLEDMAGGDEISNLLKNSAAIISARVKFFRACFGGSSSTLQNPQDFVSVADKYISSLASGGRSIKTEWNVDLQKLAFKDPQFNRLILLSLMSMGSILAFGGNIKISDNAEGQIAIEGSAERISMSEDDVKIFENLNNQGDNSEFISPKNISLAIISEIIRKDRLKLYVAENKGLVSFVVG